MADAIPLTTPWKSHARGSRDGVSDAQKKRSASTSPPKDDGGRNNQRNHVRKRLLRVRFGGPDALVIADEVTGQVIRCPPAPQLSEPCCQGASASEIHPERNQSAQWNDRVGK